MSSLALPNIPPWHASLLRSSLKTFSKVCSEENITSHMARTALQARAFRQQGCLGHSAGLGPALRTQALLQPWPCSPPVFHGYGSQSL